MEKAKGLEEIEKKQIKNESEITGEISHVWQSEKYFIMAFTNGCFATYAIYCVYAGGGEYEAVFYLNTIFDHTSEQYISALKDSKSIDPSIADEQLKIIRAHCAELKKKWDMEKLNQIKEQYGL